MQRKAVSDVIHTGDDVSNYLLSVYYCSLALMKRLFLIGIESRIQSIEL